MIRFLTLAFFFTFSFTIFGQLVSNATASGSATSADSIDQIVNLFDEPDYIPLKRGDRWVWYNISNDSISDELHFTDFIQSEKEYGSSFVLKNDSMWGIMDGVGNELIPFIYDSIILVNDYLFTQSNQQWTYHQSTGISDTFIPLQLDSVYVRDGRVYLYANGKTGMILESSILVKPKYDAIHSFSCGIDLNGIEGYVMTIDGDNFNLLDQEGEELLPENVWDLRCTEDQVFEFRRDENPEYYSPYSKEIITPNGRDIIFYRYQGYKIYSEDKSTAELHLNNGSVLKDTYDDYFILSEEIIAVRKNGKVGLTRNGTELRGAIKYDQINVVGIDRDGWKATAFQFFLGDSCGLMNQFGVEQFGAKYANILATDDDDLYVVIDNEICGVVDKNGRTVIPMEYDHIYYDNKSELFIVQNDDRIGLFRKNGTVLIPVIYERYRMLFDLNGINFTHPLHVLGRSNKLYFANSEGLIDSKPADHYDFTGSVLKVYGESDITVYALSAKGLVEEKLSYPVFNPTIIHDDYFDNWSGLQGWEKCLVEENQIEGYYGLRNYAKRGFSIEPTYRTIRRTSFNSFLGEVAFETDKINWLDDVPMKIIRSYDEVKIGSGTVENYPVFNTETVLPYDGTNNRRLNFELDRAQTFSNGYNLVFSERELQELIHFGDCAEETKYVRRFIKGGKAEICSIDSADLSLYDYYEYWNLLDAVRISPEMMKSVLNPKVGVRFIDSRQVVMNTFGDNPYQKSLEFKKPVNYELFEFLMSGIFFEKSRDQKLGKLRKFFLDKDGKEEFIDSLFSAEIVSGDLGKLILAEAPVSIMAKIHIDYPNYFFHQDSVDLSYEAGRITRRIDSNFVRLISPNGGVLADSCILIRYLSEERFAVFRGMNWELIDKNGVSVSDLKFSSVAEFTNNRAEFGFADGSAILINSNGDEVLPLPEPRIFLDDDHYFFASNPSQLINRFSNMKDKALEREKYTSKGFFVSKKDGKTSIRRFGSATNITLKSAPSLKSLGTCLYYKKGKHLYSIDSNLVTSKHKKVDKFRSVTPEIGWLEGKKDLLVDSDWNPIYTIGKTESFELRKGDLVILEDDSVKINFGSLKDKTTDSLVEKIPEVKVISDMGKYGVQQGDEMLLPMNYGWLSKINDQEFLTRINSEKHLYNSSFDRIGNRPFDSFFQTTAGNFVFFYNDQTFVVSMDRTKLRLID